MRVVFDTSALVESDELPGGIESSISTVSVAELHFGLLVAPDEQTRAERAMRLGLVEARFPQPLPVDDRVAREWGRLKAAVRHRGGQPRKRTADLAIAATAIIHGAELVTHNAKDLKIVDDLIDLRAP